MQSVRIYNTQIDNLTRAELREWIRETLASAGGPKQIVTVNPEPIVSAHRDLEFQDVLLRANLKVADGIGILWAARFLATPILSLPLFREISALLSLLVTGMLTVFYPPFAQSVIKARLPGSEIVWDLAELAYQSGQSVFILGGFGDTPKIVASKLIEKFPGLKIAGQYSGNPQDGKALDLIHKARPDVLFVAYGPVRQEKWIAKHLRNLPVKIAIGLGGTFDYIAGKRAPAPQILRYIGLEWAWRLFTQPKRLGRILNAVVVFPAIVLRYRIQLAKPYRRNVVACVVNSRGQILICRRRFHSPHPLSGKEVWQLPQGGLEAGESYESGIKRELEEETGIIQAAILGVVPNVYRYDWPPEIIFESYGGKFRGQEQSIIFVRVTDNTPIKLDQQEFDRYQWIEKKQLFERIHSVRHGLVRAVYDNFDRFVTIDSG